MTQIITSITDPNDLIQYYNSSRSYRILIDGMLQSIIGNVIIDCNIPYFNIDSIPNIVRRDIKRIKNVGGLIDFYNRYFLDVSKYNNDYNLFNV